MVISAPTTQVHRFGMSMVITVANTHAQVLGIHTVPTHPWWSINQGTFTATSPATAFTQSALMNRLWTTCARTTIAHETTNVSSHDRSRDELSLPIMTHMCSPSNLKNLRKPCPSFLNLRADSPWQSHQLSSVVAMSLFMANAVRVCLHAQTHFKATPVAP